MVGQGGCERRSCLAALGAALMLAISLLAPGVLGGVALAASGTSSTTPTPSTTQSAPPEGSNGSAFSELSKGGGEEEGTNTQTTEKTSNESTTHNSKKTIITIVVVALVVLVAIGFVIVRDARKNAPATDPQVAEARTAHDTATMMRKRRAKAKAARRARKQNR